MTAAPDSGFSSHQTGFAPLVGTWDAHVQVFQGAGGVPNESRGQMINTLVLGDRYLEQRYRDESEGMQGLGYWGYNDAARQHEYVWMDTMSTIMMVGHGGPSPDGRTFTTAGTIRTSGDGQMRHRSVLTILNENQHTYDIFFKRPEGQEFRALHITYTRRGGG